MKSQREKKKKTTAREIVCRETESRIYKNSYNLLEDKQPNLNL